MECLFKCLMIYIENYLVLRFPFPFITTASGNWTSSTTASEPGGPDGSLEFVNHKSYNCVTVGNNQNFNTDGTPNGISSSSDMEKS